MASPTRLIAIETLKQGAALLEVALSAKTVGAAHSAHNEWADWATVNASNVMESLTAFAALEEILDHTHITELIWWGDPGCWGLKTDADQTGEEEGEWQGADLATVLRGAAADFAAADEADEADDDAGTQVLRG